MGAIAKADGRVTKDEIQLAQSVMQRLGLDAEMRQSAQKLFNEGKSPEFPLSEVLNQFRRECHRRTTLIQMFLEIQIQVALADGSMHPAEWEILEEICRNLGVSQATLRRLREMMEAGFGRSGYHPGQTSQTSIQDAYKILGVDASISDADLKKTYRRLMSQHHPDKLVAKGLPDEMVQDATEKTQQIKEAYEIIKASRG